MAGVRTIRRFGGALSAAALLGVAFAPARAQQAGAAPQAPQAQAPAPAGRGGGGLNDACGGRSGNPTEACPNDVTQNDRDARPAARQAAGHAAEAAQGPDLVADPVSRIPALVDSRWPRKMIEEMGKKTGAWTSTTSWDVDDITAENLKQYDAIFLSNTTGTFLDDPERSGRHRRTPQGVPGLPDGRQGRRRYPRHWRLVPRRPRPAGAGGGRAAAAPPAAPGGCSGGSAGRRAAGGGGRGTPPPCSVSEAQKQERPAEPLWPWWDEAIGGYFKFHWNYPTPITVKIDDPKSPMTAAFKRQVVQHDRRGLHVQRELVLARARARADQRRLQPDERAATRASRPHPRKDHDFALSWIQKVGQGRVFYQALGHHESIYYNNPDMLAHILAGMQYALGDLKADDTPSKKKS